MAWTTTESETQAVAMAEGAVAARLVACAQIDGPIRSVYRWKDAVESASEYRILFKYPGSRRSELRDWVHRHHPYETPEWVEFEAGFVEPGYANWARDACR